MAATLASVRTAVSLRLQDPNNVSVSSANVNAFINTAISYYKYRRYWFNEAVATIALTLGNSVVPSIPADFLEEIKDGGLTISYSQMFYRLNKITSQEFNARNVTGRGMPYCYTYRAQQFEVYYVPDQAYSLVLRYLKDYADLAIDADTNDWLTYADQMIMYNALSRIYGELKQDPNMESYYTARAADEEDRIKRRAGALSGTGNLSTYSNLI